MREKKQAGIMPLQPYLLLMAENYQRISCMRWGISHYYEFEMAKDGEHTANAVPDGSVDLLFNIGEDKVSTYLSGTVFRLKEWDMGSHSRCFGVRFQPGFGILPEGLGMQMIVDQDICIDGDLFGEGLTEKIAYASDIQDRSRIFEEAYQAFAAEALTGSKERVEAFIRKRICATGGTLTMETLTEETGYSACYIRRIFKEYNGISPKQFSSFIRFQHLLRLLNQESVSYEEVALDCGYYDEAHMIKEFRRYTGTTPQRYSKMLAGKSRDMNI